MTLKDTAYFSLAITIAFIFSIAHCAPQILSDDNEFFRDFSGYNLITTLGIIITINISLITSLLLEIKKIEDHRGFPIFRETRKSLKQDSYAMILIIALSLLLPIIKLALPPGSYWSLVLNGSKILLFEITIFIMADVVMTIFNISEK